MSILITGGTGKLGKELAGVFPSALTPDRNELDITDRKSVFDYVKSKRPDMIIHTAAFTDVARSESEPEIAWKTNVTGTENLVDACVAHAPSVRFVYISTACVFDGVKGMFTESDLPHPKNFYSLTKLLGEFVVKKMPVHTIVRTNFVVKEPWPYQRAFTDRYGTYLFAEDVARGIKEMVESGISGTVHLAGDKRMSMFELAKITTPGIQPMTLKDYKGPSLTVDMSLGTDRWKRYRISA
jgi:dTDP-4-dehydrorhamnose reductase